MTELHRKNHFVPQFYLKKWSSDGHKIWGYKLLVPHQNVPLWKLYSIKSIAYHSHLYTVQFDDGESDEFERWIEKEFETPAEEAITKVISGRRLYPEDWEKLIKFAAAQSMRTPARLQKELERMKNEMPRILDTTLQNVVKALEEGSIPKSLSNTSDDGIEYLPINISKEPSTEPGKALLKVETLVGRSAWLYEVKHILTKTIKVLLNYKWSIMHPAHGVKWITSDDPVIPLNYYGKGSYNYGGGWGRKGSQILLPLSPQHMLYIQVGEKSPPRIDLSYERSIELLDIIAKHADRHIFATEPIEEIENIRPRIVDPEAYKDEKKVWARWHEEQSSAEKKYVSKTKDKKPNDL